MGLHLASRRVSLRHVTIDDLDKCDSAVVRLEVEDLCLDASRLHGLPFQIVAPDLGVWCCLAFFGNRLNGRRPVDRLLCSGDIGQPGRQGSKRVSDLVLPGWFLGLVGSCSDLLLLGPFEHGEE